MSETALKWAVFQVVVVKVANTLASMVGVVLCLITQNPPMPGENAMTGSGQSTLLDAVWVTVALHDRRATYANLDRTKRAVPTGRKR